MAGGASTAVQQGAHVREIEQCSAVQTQKVSRCRQGDSLDGEVVRHRISVSAREHLRERGTPEHLGEDVVSSRGALARPCEPVCIVVTPLLVEDVREPGRDRGAQFVLADPLEVVVTRDELTLRRLEIPRHLLDFAWNQGARGEREGHSELLEDRPGARVGRSSLDRIVGHRKQVGEHAENRRFDPADAARVLEHLAAPRDRHPDRHGSVAEAGAEPDLDLGRLALLAGGGGVDERLLERGGFLSEVADESADLAAKTPDAREPKIVSRRLEERHDTLRQLDDLTAPPGGVGLEEDELPLELGPRRPEVVTVRTGILERLLEERFRLGQLTELGEQSPDASEQLRLVGMPDCELCGALKQVQSRRKVAAMKCTAPGGCESHSRTLAQLLRYGVHRTKLGPKTEGLLEVVADDLLVLRGSLTRRGLEKGRSPLVQLRPCFLRQSLVRGVANEDMTEAVRLGATQRHGVVEEEFLPQQRFERTRDESLLLVRRDRAH